MMPLNKLPAYVHFANINKSTYCHYRKRLICHVPNSLPCAKRRAHGKQLFCRVPQIKHTANPTHKAKLHLYRVPALGTHGKNKTHGILPSLPCAILKTHGKPRARATHVRRWRTEVDRGATEVDGRSTLPCATWGTRQTCHFAVCYSLAHGKQDTSPCAFFLAHGKQFENFEFSNSKLFLRCRDIAWYSVLKFGIFS